MVRKTAVGLFTVDKLGLCGVRTVVGFIPLSGRPVGAAVVLVSWHLFAVVVVGGSDVGFW
ncbi:hypothetical protein SKA58_19635 [Sphingomonas sp. SKA58]|nr:hypothetical protein SKA58_19635 [Sphingomonas sp. SKA58]